MIRKKRKFTHQIILSDACRLLSKPIDLTTMKANFPLLFAIVLSGTHSMGMGYPLDMFAEHPCLRNKTTLVVKESRPVTNHYCASQASYMWARRVNQKPEPIYYATCDLSFLNWVQLDHTPKHEQIAAYWPSSQVLERAAIY